MRSAKAFVGARVVDSLPFSQSGTAQQAFALQASGVEGLAGYLGAMNPARLAYLMDAGLAYVPVTFAGEYFDGASDELAHLAALKIPTDTTVFLDLEGIKSFKWPANDLVRLIDDWAAVILAAGYMPGLYVGSPQPLTASELARLSVVRYWKAPSRVLDRNGMAWDEPAGCGWCMTQMWPQGFWKDTDVFVDVNIVGEDRKGRVPHWVVA